MRFIGTKTVLLLFFSFFISIPVHADTNSTINGNAVEWKLLFGNNIDPVSGILATGERKKTPIVLVHGNRSESETQGRWSNFLNHISSYDQFDVWIWIHDTSKPVGFNGYTGNASELAECLSYILPYYKPGTRPILVAHSRGGLVCRSYMNYDYDNDIKLEGEKILGLITLGTPHHGSPAAVPDWTAYAFWEKFILPPITYDLIYGLVFDVNRLGDLNLAWDNEDGVIPSGIFKIEYDSNLSSNGEMYLTQRDTNENVKIEYHDETIFFKDQWETPDYKTMFGTLSELNKREKYFKKIVAFGAYDDILLDNTDYSIGNAIFFQLDHSNLEIVTPLLASFDINNVTKEGIKFCANDGLVPLQSALFLDISDGSIFCSNILSVVSIDEPLIKSHRQVKKHYIYTGTIRDHLHLLDTDEHEYWEAIISEIKAFTIKAMPWVPLLLLDDNMADISGYWEISNSSAGESGDSGYIQLQQSEGNISGTWLCEDSESITGSINGTQISFSWTENDGNTVTCTGNVNGNTMSGTWSDTSGGSGIWETMKVNQPNCSYLLKLPDTGQTKCYNNSTEIVCPQAGASFYGQDAHYTINPPSYTNNGDGTVTDNVTGLMWQKEDDDTRRTWDFAISYCNNLTLASYSDWRLPSKKELINIVNYNTYDPSIDTMYFPNINLNPSIYWSSTTLVGHSDLAFGVAFHYGQLNNPYKHTAYYVRCVRGEQ